MKFSFYKSDLLDALKLVTKAVAVKPQTPILSGIYLKADNSTLELQANNFSVGTIVRIPVNVEAAGVTCVGGKRFAEIIAKLPDDTATVELADNKLKISSGAAKFELMTFDADDFPQVKKTEGTELTIRAAKLKEIVSRVASAVAKDDIRPIFTGVFFDLKDGTIKAVATNTHRINYFETAVEYAGEMNMLIPGTALRDLAAAMPNDETFVKITTDNKSVTFQVNNIMMTVRQVAGMFPPYEKVLKVEENFSLKVNRDELKSAINRVAVVAKEGEYNSVKLTIEEGLMTISAQTESTSAEESLEIVGGGELAIGFNYQYMLDMLGSIDSKELRLGFGEDQYKPSKWQGDGEENFIGVITPVRMRGGRNV